MSGKPGDGPSGGNAELVRRAYALWNSDPTALLPLVAADIEIRLSGVFGDIPTTYRGYEGVQAFTRNVREVWEEFHAEPVETVDVDHERVLVRTRFTGRGRSGIAVERTFGHVYAVRDDMFRRIESFATWEEAVEAVGLSR